MLAMGAGWLDAQESRAMTTKPRALDLFCGAGGVSRGLQLAGLDVHGVDIRPMFEHVPPGVTFTCGDVFELIDGGDIDLDEYDFVWASPPSWSCSCDAAKSEDYDALIEAA